MTDIKKALLDRQRAILQQINLENSGDEDPMIKRVKETRKKTLNKTTRGINAAND
jgi:hypothetical protein